MTKTVYNTQISGCISKAFKELDWHYQFDENKGVFRAGVSIDGPIQDIQIIIAVRKDDFSVFGVSPIRADKTNTGMMAKLAEFITRANYGLKNGCFEMDYRDGEIRYRSYVDCDGVIPSHMVIVDSIHVCASMFERYAPGIVSILFTDKSAADAVEECENETQNHIAHLLSQMEEEMNNTDSQPDGTSDDSSAGASGDESSDLDDMFARLMARLGPTST